jgi:hypothetical protein
MTTKLYRLGLTRNQLRTYSKQSLIDFFIEKKVMYNVEEYTKEVYKYFNEPLP